MRNRALHLLLIAALVMSVLFITSGAPASQASEAPDAPAEPQAASSLSTDKQLPSHLGEVPADLQALFADGMTPEEFVQMAGYVPSALADLVEGDALMILEFEEAPLAVAYAEEKANGRTMAAAAIESTHQRLLNAQTAVTPKIESLGATVIANYTAAYNGMQVLTPLNKLNELRALPGVKAIHRAPIHEPALSASVPLIGTTDVWNDFGYDGDGMVIAIIDTGIDYTHAALGGSGDPADYAGNDPDVIEPGTFPTAKVIGGYDFAGTLYHAGCSAANEAAGICTRIPAPDRDPLDENGHGTHVASISAGAAVGDVSNGVAPAARLLALKVFGVSGSTALTINALDFATYSYLLYGYPHVINMSLGSNFGTNDPANPAILGSQNAAAAGIVVVASAGNAGNNSYITGSPGSADRAISVAASTTGFVTGPTLNVVGATDPTQQNIVYQPASFANNTGHFVDPLTAPIGYVGALAGAADNLLCTTEGIAPNALAGHIALIQRGACTFASKVNNAASLGAVGAIIFNNAPGVLGMTGDPVLIPAGSIQMQDGMNLVPANGQLLAVSAESDVSTVPDPYTPADSIATFSSRGPRGYDSALKPEVTAPGVGIFAADMGSGGGGVSLSGTSMAAPHVAGVAALMLQGNPTWTPEQVKAVLMNTAVPLVDNTTMPLSGAGRINAYRAVDAVVVAMGDTDLVSLSFGVIMSRNDSVTRVKQVTLHNWGDADQLFDAAAAFQTGSRTNGATLMVDPAQVTVPAGGSATVDVTLTLDMTQIPVTYGAAGAEEYFGFVSFTPPGGDPTDTLLVPFYAQPRPYSQLEEIVASGVITDPSSDIATFELTHRGPIASDLWVYPALFASEEPDPAMAGPGDVRMFGMDYVGSHPTYGDIVGVAINAWNYWHTPQPFFAEFDLYVDADQDGEWDYINFNWNNGARTGGGNNNVWVVVQVDLSDGMLYLASPFTIYTDYNASYMEWLLPAAWQDLGPDASTFDYQLVGFDVAGVSITPPGSFDYAQWPFDWLITNDPGPAEREAEIWVEVNSLDGYNYTQPLGIMIVDYNGDPRNQNGAQAYFEPIEVVLTQRTYFPLVFSNFDTAEWLDLTILHTNDFHARVDEYNRNGARCMPADADAGLCIAGAPRLATKVAEIRNDKANLLLLDAGDQFQGTLFYNVFKGDVLAVTMNALGYDAMTLGNHEFDSGPGVLASFIDQVDFPVVSANTDASADPDLQGKIPPYVILERGGHEIGIIGLITTDTANISSPGPNVVFTDPFVSLQAAADELTAMGVDKIIALTHMGYDVDLALAEQVSGVDIIIGGHSHSFLYSPRNPISFSPPTFPQFGPLLPVGEYPTVVESPAEEPVLVITAYQWGTFLGNLDVTFGPGGIVRFFDGNPIFLGADVAKDAELDEALEPYRAAVADLIATEVGETTVDLLIVDGGQQICRLGECLMGNLVADAMLWRANQAEPGANYLIAFQNGGGLRAPILTGTVTLGDVMETLPFGNAIATFELQGQYVKAALENGASRYPSANGGFAQVSGLRYVIDPAQPVGERIASVEVWNGTDWEPLDMDAMYKVVTNDFMRRGGDNYLMFRDFAVNPYDFGPALDEALADYFREFSPVTPEIEGRITFTP